VVAVVLSGLLVVFEKRFIYHPSRSFADDVTPDTPVEDCFFQTDDDVRLHGWWHAAENPESPVLLWFHGNAGNLTHRSQNMEMLARRGFSFFIIDYRGYGRSGGDPSEQGLYRDGLAAWDYLTEEKAVSPERLVIFGRSLGSAVALHTALNRPCAGLVLESAFTSAPAMARELIPVLPVWLLMRSSFNNLNAITELDVPVLIAHGDQDDLVPFEHGRALFEAASEPKRFLRIEGAGHNDTYLVGGDSYFKTLQEFCEKVADADPHSNTSETPQNTTHSQ
jgi:hypothetical protein